MMNKETIIENIQALTNFTDVCNIWNNTNLHMKEILRQDAMNDPNVYVLATIDPATQQKQYKLFFNYDRPESMENKGFANTNLDDTGLFIYSKIWAEFKKKDIEENEENAITDISIETIPKNTGILDNPDYPHTEYTKLLREVRNTL